MDYLLGIDLGTTNCKAVLISRQGDLAAAASCAHPTSYPDDNWAEQDPKNWWKAVQSAVQQALTNANIQPKAIAAIGITGQMHGLVLLDESNNIIRPAILWNDHRSSNQCNTILEKLPEIETITQNPVIPAFTLPKLLWVKENEPVNYQKIHRILLPKDYLGFRITGKHKTEPSDASGTCMFDNRTIGWSKTVLETFQIPVEWLPVCEASTAIRGVVIEEAARQLGVPAGIPVIHGAGDQAAQAVGMGIIHTGVLGLTLGTSGVIVSTQHTPKYGAFCHALPNRWLLLNSMHAAGLSLSWFRETFLPDLSFEAISSLAEASGLSDQGSIYLPFLVGERAAAHHSVPAGFIGITPRHTSGSLVRAIMEGVAFEFKRMVTTWIPAAEQPFHEIRLSGGGANSKVWVSTIANVLEAPVRVIHRDASFGAAAIAGLGCGWWSDAAAFYSQTTSQSAQSEAFHPEPGLKDIYARKYEQYLYFYQRLTPQE